MIGGGGGTTRVLRCSNKACEYQTPVMGGGLNLMSRCPVCGSEMKYRDDDPSV
jgi:hypothetical protein